MITCIESAAQDSGVTFVLPVAHLVTLLSMCHREDRWPCPLPKPAYFSTEDLAAVSLWECLFPSMKSPSSSQSLVNGRMLQHVGPEFWLL